jgi:hypothetical protein
MAFRGRPMALTQGGWQANLLTRKFCQLLIAAWTTWQNSKKKLSRERDQRQGGKYCSFDVSGPTLFAMTTAVNGR